MASEKIRFALTVLAVAWATLCISTMLATGEGLRAGLSKSAEQGSGKLILVTGGNASVNNGTFHVGQTLKLNMGDVAAVKSLPSVKMAIPTASWDVPVMHGNNSTWQTPLAVPPAYQKLMGFHVLSGGRWINNLDMTQSRHVVVLGQSAAQDLFHGSPKKGRKKGHRRNLKGDSASDNVNPVGQVIKISGIRFTIIGVLAPSNADIGEGTPIDYAVFVPIETWQGLNFSAPLTTIDVEPKANVNRQRVASTVRQTIILKQGASLADQQVLQVTDMLLRQKTMLTFLTGLQVFLGVIGGITLLVAGIGIANVMYATVKRATRDIGVRMAVGATPMHIKSHYLLQSLLTMMLGGCIGLCLTLLVIEVIHLLPLEGNRLFDSLGKPLPVLNITVLIVVIAALIFVGVVAAWFPARRAAHITPLEALKSE
jgi:putative ABC transport system permease protein